MQTIKFSLRQRLKSFTYAFAGLYQFFATQHNAIIHTIATVIVCIGCYLFPLSSIEIIGITIAVALVWAAELFNTAIEQLCDMVCPQQNPKIKFIKDIAAAAVLITAINAVIIGSIIFIPKFL